MKYKVAACIKDGHTFWFNEVDNYEMNEYFFSIEKQRLKVAFFPRESIVFAGLAEELGVVM